jgi:RNA ligase (TIGR02306 family)
LIPLNVLQGNDIEIIEGQDVSAQLGIFKWEAPETQIREHQNNSEKESNFPIEFPRTEQKRCQNYIKVLKEHLLLETTFEISEKLEGTSMTCYFLRGEFGVCSRNQKLEPDGANSGWYFNMVKKYNLEEKLQGLGKDIAIQGEVIGPKVLGNIYKLTDLEFRVFDVYLIKQAEYMLPNDRREFVKELGLLHVPVLQGQSRLEQFDVLLESADGKSVLYPKQRREGLVYKQTNGPLRFKVISNEYLLKSSQ